jgi:hypothetical protein
MYKNARRAKNNDQETHDGEISLMKLGQPYPLRAFLFFFAALFVFALALLPASAQRVSVGADVGEISDRFGGQPRVTGAVGAIDGEVIAWQSADRDHGADIVAGGELRWPEDASNHASEQSIYGGFGFHLGPRLTAGIHIQIHRLVPPPTFGGNPVMVFNRDRMEVLEPNGFVQYKFGPSNRYFIRAEATPEFSPRFHPSPSGAPPFEHPNLDHGYAIRGVLGYNFGKWYVKGTYQTRYFRFQTNFNNPDEVYNWRSDFVTGGVGFNF